MLQGLAVRELLFSEVQAESRLDSGFATHSDINWLESLKEKRHFFPLREALVSIGSGHTPYKHDLSQGDVGFITVECVSPLVLHQQYFKSITTQQYQDEYANKRIKEGSVLCTIKRRICQAYPFLEKPTQRLAINQDVALLQPKSGVNAAYLATYLSCKVGQSFADKQKTEQINPYISVANLATLPFCLVDESFQSEIEILLKKANTEADGATSTYAQAETLLLDALGLTNWQPPTPLAYEQPASAVFASGRIDAEFYQPRYEALIEHLQQHAPRWRRVREFAVVCGRGKQPEYSESGKFAVINSKHVLETTLDYDNFERTDFGDPSSAIRRGDILTYTTGGFSKKPGRTAVYLDDEPAFASNHVNLTRVKEENSIYVGVVMNSLIGREQSAAISTGSIQQELYPSDIQGFIIPFVAPDTQAAIVAAVEAAHAARRQAKRLLEAAKRAVEVAIEEGEAAALAYLATVTTK